MEQAGTDRPHACWSLRCLSLPRLGGQFYARKLSSAHVPSAKALRSAQNCKKISRLASRQTTFCEPTDRKYLPGARKHSRRTFYERSCCSMRTSSMLTRQISLRARRLWRAQTNPYAAQNPARARVSARATHLCARPRKGPPRRSARICTRSAASGRPWPWYEAGAVKWWVFFRVRLRRADELCLREALIPLAATQQLLVFSIGDDATGVHHDDAVGVEHR